MLINGVSPNQAILSDLTKDAYHIIVKFYTSTLEKHWESFLRFLHVLIKGLIKRLSPS